MVYAGGRRIRLPGRLPRKALDARWGAADGRICWCCQDLIRNAIRFLFQRVVAGAYREFGL